jgi:hypothetical protein
VDRGERSASALLSPLLRWFRKPGHRGSAGRSVASTSFGRRGHARRRASFRTTLARTKPAAGVLGVVRGDPGASSRRLSGIRCPAGLRVAAGHRGSRESSRSRTVALGLSRSATRIERDTCKGRAAGAPTPSLLTPASLWWSGCQRSPGLAARNSSAAGVSRTWTFGARTRPKAGPRGVVHATLSRAGVRPSETLVVERKQVVTAELVRRSRLVQQRRAAETCAGLASSGAVGDLLCRCALLHSAIKKRSCRKCVRFSIPFSRDPRNPDVGKLLKQGARFRVQGSDVLLANLRAAV